MKSTYDVIVAGLGAMGSAALYHLAARQIDVLGLDRFLPPHDRGASHGYTRTIRLAYQEGLAYVPLVRRALELWRELEQNGRRLLVTTGGLTIGLPDSTAVTGCIDSATRFNIVHEVLSSSEIHSRHPQLLPPDDFVGVFEPSTGVLHPEACIRAHLDSARQRGAQIAANQPLQRWEVQSSGQTLRVYTSKGVYHTGCLILTTGAWSSGLLAQYDIQLHPKRVLQHWLKPTRLQKQFRAPQLPVHFWQMPDGTECYGHPMVGNREPGVKIGFHNIISDCDPEVVDKAVTPQDLARLETFIKAHIPALAGHRVRTDPSVYTLSPDCHFVIGALPGNPRLLLGVGLSGHGFKFASAIGEALADLALIGKTTLDISAFSPTRLTTTPKRMPGNAPVH